MRECLGECRQTVSPPGGHVGCDVTACRKLYVCKYVCGNNVVCRSVVAAMACRADSLPAACGPVPAAAPCRPAAATRAAITQCNTAVDRSPINK